MCVMSHVYVCHITCICVTCVTCISVSYHMHMCDLCHMYMCVICVYTCKTYISRFRGVSAKGCVSEGMCLRHSALKSDDSALKSDESEIDTS